jgi:hypothetical protein
VTPLVDGVEGINSGADAGIGIGIGNGWKIKV